MKKLLIAILLSLVLIVSCSNNEVIENKDFISSLEQLNNDLLDESEDINGELIVNISAGVSYQSSSVEVGIVSDNSSNSVYYDASVSAQTILHLLNSITKKSDSEIDLSSIVLYSNSDEKNLTENGNKSGNILTFDAKVLEKIYAGNKLYLANEDNKILLGKKLNEYKISSTLEKNGDETKYVTELILSPAQLANIIPFINIDETKYNGELKLKFYQNSVEDPITKIDLILYNHSFSTDNDIAYLDVDVVLSFALDGGTDNE